jgi:hypothetical protein
MDEERPEKHVVRDLWGQLVQNKVGDYMDGGPPLYLTLCGAEGRDIETLVDRGVLQLTEVGSIVDEHRARVVAVESSMPAVARLKDKFPGLRVINEPFSNLLSGMEMTTWPKGENAKLWQSHVVNLDLNKALAALSREGQVIFPDVQLIEKIALLHSKEPTGDWWLCLTLNATINWADDVASGVQRFLAENFEAVPDFASAARQHLGDELYEAIVQAPPVELSELPAEDRQCVLMTLVPKKLSISALHHGWRVETSANIRYGGESGSAPMVTWIFKFCWDPRASTSPQLVYRESLLLIHDEVKVVATDGSISESP